MASIYPKSFFSETSIECQKGTCFVIMPFDKKFDSVFKMIKNVLETDLHIECKRADDFHKPHIIETILKAIIRSEFIIADLTEANANVFYELGLVHCTKNMEKVVIVTQNLSYVPFDLQQFRCIIYESSSSGHKRLKKEIIKTFSDASLKLFRIKLEENKPIVFENKLTGDGEYLYELTFESTSIGFDGIKIQINSTQYAADKTKRQMGPQYGYLGVDSPSIKINNVPWTITLLRINNKIAIISIEEDTKVTNKNDIPERVEIEASFQGGDANWKKYLEKNLDANVPVRKGAPTGTYIVVVSFVIERDGSVSGLKALTTHGYGMEEEAVRVIMKSPRWNPAIQNGRMVKAYRKQPITFQIED